MHPRAVQTFTWAMLAIGGYVASLFPAVFAQNEGCPSGWVKITGTAPSGAQQLAATVAGLFVAIQAIIYVIILLGWLMGLVMWSAPSKSMIIKKGGVQQTEVSGIALFLALIGPALISFIVWLAGAFNSGGTTYCTPTA